MYRYIEFTDHSYEHKLRQKTGMLYYIGEPEQALIEELGLRKEKERKVQRWFRSRIRIITSGDHRKRVGSGPCITLRIIFFERVSRKDHYRKYIYL